MKAPISWLKEYVDINVDVETLCKKMVSIGYEIESIEYLGNKFSGVLVGQITAIERHPDAEKLQVCQVDMGSQQTLQIITAATNVFVGAKVPVATHNAKLADGTVIKNSKLRGLPSQGMFCGGDELGITNANYPNAEVDGILILSNEEQIGANLIDVLGLNDYVLDFAVTFNRPDCNSIYGLAREVAVALGEKLKPIATSFVEDSSTVTSNIVAVEVLDKDLCPNYYMQGATDVKIAPSPLWMTRRLAACGINSINTIVDITNYVLLELGQPMHAFDYKDITDSTIIVRRAKEGEKIVPLNKKEYELNDNILVIADKQRPVGLAGVMGGENSEIKTSTNCVLFESAKFSRENIRRTSRALSIRTDSSSRFEKGVDAYTAQLALSRALYLVNKLQCGKVTFGRIEIFATREQEKSITFSLDRITNLLGITIPSDIVIDILRSLEIKASVKDNLITCIAPPYRDDLQRDCDFIEEIIRVYGYDNITSTLLKNTEITYAQKTPKQSLINTSMQTLVCLGYHQCVTYSFGGKQLFGKMNLENNTSYDDYVAILNPLGEEFSILRKSILPHLLEVVSANQNHKNDKANLFEISKTFTSTNDSNQQPLETYKLALIQTVGDFYALKSAVNSLLQLFGLQPRYVRSAQTFLHPGISADIICGESNVGFLGELHPVIKQNFELNQKVYVCEIDLEKVCDLTSTKIKYVQIPRLPSVDRDLALIVDNKLLVQDLIDTIKSTCKLCESVELFDVYTGEQVPSGKKSIALSLRFRVQNRTLTDKDVDVQVKKILKTLEDKFGALLR